MDRGIVVAYDVAKGFGFIRSSAFTADVFVHASAVSGGVALRVGQRVAFEAEPDERGPRASRVEPGRAGLTSGRAASIGLVVGLAAIAIGLRLAGLGRLPAWLVAINLATGSAFAFDKHRAVRLGRRVPEAFLLGLAALGGTPAALAAMLALRHKTRKASFLIPLGVIVVLQVGGIVAIISRRVG